MAEFVQVMKDWKRMCNDCTTTCSLFDGLCKAIPEMSIQDLSDTDISEIEETVVAWAAEHPEPVYPTWVEYLVGIGVIPQEIRLETADALMDTHLLKPIPADIAEKLGLQPKTKV